MKLHDGNLEAAALYAICSGKNYEYYITNLREDHFHETFAKEAYERILTLLRSHDRPPSWDALTSDPSLDEGNRRLLRALTPRKVAQDLIDNLENYRQTRAFYDAYEYMNDCIRAKKIDIGHAMRETASRLERSAKNASNTLLTDHEEDMANLQMLDEYQSGSVNRVIRTGLKVFDDKNGGVIRGSHFLIAGPSGEGKSAVAEIIGLNMAIRGRPGGKGTRVCFVSLEMPERMVWTRAISSIAGVDVNDIMNNRLSVERWNKLKNTYLLMRHLIRLNEGAFKVFVPRSSMNIEQLLAFLRPHKYDVVIIDYLSLLSGFSDTNFWQKIGEAANLCQSFAVANDNVMISLAQATDEGNIRLSQQLKDNAGLMWIWESKRRKGKKEENAVRPGVRSQQVNQIDSFDIEMPKARMQTPFTMRLYRRLELMQISDDADKLGQEWIRSWPSVDKLWAKINLPFRRFKGELRRHQRAETLRRVKAQLAHDRKQKKLIVKIRPKRSLKRFLGQSLRETK